MKTKIFFTIVLYVTVKSTIAQEKINFINTSNIDFTETLNQAKEEKKLVFVYFTTDGCAPCIRMAREVFPDTELVDYLNSNFVCVKSKWSKNNVQDSELRNKYNIRGNPNFVVINSKGDVIHRMPRAAMGSGYKSKDELIQFGKEALGSENNYAAYKSKFENGDLSYESVSAYLEFLPPIAMHVVDGDYDNETQRVLDKYFTTQAEDSYSSENNWHIISNYVDNASTEPFHYLLKNSEVFYEKYGRDVVDKRIFQVLEWYGDYGDVLRTKKTKKEMKNWNYPQIKAFLKQIE